MMRAHLPPLLVLLVAAPTAHTAAQAARDRPPVPAAPRPAAPPARTTPAPTPAPVLEGTVKGPDARPVEKALVLAQPAQMAFGPPAPALTTRTDAAGRFRLALKAGGLHTVRVEAAGLAAQTLTKVRLGAPLSVTLQKGGAIEGSVRDGSTGAPLPRVRVEARDERTRMVASWEPGAGVVTTMTDARGRFRLEGLTHGLHTVAARARGFGRSERGAVPTGGRVDLYLFAGATLSGTVRDAGGRPQAGAVVRAESEAFRFGRGGSLETTGAEGRFEVTGLEAGIYRVTARHPEFAPGWVHGVVLDRGSEAALEVIVHRGSTVHGRLIDANEQPVLGQVRLQETDERAVPMGLEDVLRSEAGPDGRFRLERVPPGSHSLAVTASGYAPQRVEASVGTGGAPVDVGDVVLETGLMIRGRVRDQAGSPVAEARVLAWMERRGMSLPADARANPDGTFVLGGLTAGTHRVTVNAPGYGEENRPVEAGADEVEFVLQPAGTISGTVVDESGRTVESFRVSARPVQESGSSIRRAQRFEPFGSPDGRFVVEDVAPGTYVVEVSAPDRADGVVSNVKVASGATTNVGRVRLGAGGIVRGMVVDLNGGPVVGATVSVHGPGRDFFGPAPEAMTDAAGTFEVRGVAAGTVQVSARHPHYAAGLVSGIEVDPAKGPGEARIVLSQGGRVEGRALRRDGSGLAAMVNVSPAREGFGLSRSGPSMVQTAPDGSFAVEHVPAGRAWVMLMMGSGGMFESRQSREVEVREGETTSVEFVSREILVSGRVTRSGVPAPGLRVELFGGAAGRMMLSVGTGAPSVPAPTSGPQRLNGLTREDGSYELLVDEPGRYLVNVMSADGRSLYYPRREVEIPDADTYALDLAFSGVPVAGLVVDQETEQPIANAYVFASPREGGGPGGGGGAAGADGRFTLELEPGEYRLSARAEGYAPSNLELTVGSGGASDVRLELSRGATLSGRIVDVAGRPVGGVSISAMAPEPEARIAAGMASSLPDGSFQVMGLQARSYNLLARSEAGSFALRTGATPGEKGVTLTLRRGGRVALQVRGPDGNPAESAHAFVSSIGGVSVSLPFHPLTSAQGTAELLVPAGSIELRVRKEKLEGLVTLSVPEGGTVPAEVTLSEAREARQP